MQCRTFDKSVQPKHSFQPCITRSLAGGRDFLIRIRRFRNFVLGWGVLLGGLAFGASSQAQMVRLAWNPSSNNNVAGYRIYYGLNSRRYTQVVDAGNTTGVAIANLNPGVTYYFASTAYNVVGLESVFSTEISYTPTTAARLLLNLGSTALINATGLPGHIYEIQTSSNLSTWTSLGTVTAGSNGSFQFTDPNAKNFTRRFYRTRDTTP